MCLNSFIVKTWSWTLWTLLRRQSRRTLICMQIVPQPFSFASVLCCSSGTDGGFITTLIGVLSSTVYLFHVLHCLQPVTLALLLLLLLLLHLIVYQRKHLWGAACRMLPCSHPLSQLSLNKKQAKWFIILLIRRVHQPQPPNYCCLDGHKAFVVRELWSHWALMVTRVTLVTELLWSFLHGCWWWISVR